MSATEFIASYWTLAGQVTPLGPPPEEASKIDFLDRASAAARLGYSGLGLMHSDLMNIQRRHSLTEMRAILADHQLKHLEIEFLVGWMADGEELAQMERTFADMLKAAHTLDVRHFKIGPDMNAIEWPLERMVERFAMLCERARAVDVAIALEPMPWSNLAKLPPAIDVVAGAGQANGGLLLDIWHIARGGIPYADIAALPGELINYVELNDADHEIRGTLLEDTLNHRKHCGEGDLDVAAFITAVRGAGYAGPYGIEILSAVERKRPYGDVAADAISTTKAILAGI